MHTILFPNSGAWLKPLERPMLPSSTLLKRKKVAMADGRHGPGPIVLLGCICTNTETSGQHDFQCWPFYQFRGHSIYAGDLKQRLEDDQETTEGFKDFIRSTDTVTRAWRQLDANTSCTMVHMCHGKEHQWAKFECGIEDIAKN